jgi:predicted phosphodiesterase
MKVALISDIHGNLPALNAVSKQARQQQADVIWRRGECNHHNPFYGNPYIWEPSPVT